MKVSDILDETVIDFNAFKQSRKPSKPVQTQANLNRHDNTMATVSDHLELLIDYVDEVKSRTRLPHFAHFDDIFTYINTTLKYPFNRYNVDKWYDQLQHEDRVMVDMIGQHSGRLLKTLNTIEEKVNDFVKSVPKTVKMPDRVRYLLSMIDYDRSVLGELDRLMSR